MSFILSDKKDNCLTLELIIVDDSGKLSYKLKTLGLIVEEQIETTNITPEIESKIILNLFEEIRKRVLELT